MREDEITQFLSGLDQETATIKKVRFPEFAETAAPGIRIGLDYLEDVRVDLAVELGEVEMTLGEFLKLQEGSIIKLNRAAGEIIDLMLNGVKFARGEVLVINDVFALRVHEIALPRPLHRGEEG
jgi:flagellar motor switch protein FliN/FliY